MKFTTCPTRLLTSQIVRLFTGGQGFEPRYADPESAVLPLDDPPKLIFIVMEKLMIVKYLSQFV